MFVDTAKTVGAKLLVWSALESFTELSNGRFANVPHFDSKAEVTRYAKSSVVPLAVVKAGYYMTNVLEGLQGLKAGPDGTYVFGLPVAGSMLVPLIDVESDFGMYIRVAIESPTLGAGADIRSGRLISFEEIIAQAAEGALDWFKLHNNFILFAACAVFPRSRQRMARELGDLERSTVVCDRYLPGVLVDSAGFLLFF
jgi:hypothetical protein